MEIIVTDGVSIKIDDEEIISDSFEEIVGFSVRLKNGLKLVNLPSVGNVFFIDDKSCRVAHPR